MFAAGYIWNYMFFRVKSSSDGRRGLLKVLAELSDEERGAEIRRQCQVHRIDRAEDQGGVTGPDLMELGIA
jgi:hypothetical protein